MSIFEIKNIDETLYNAFWYKLQQAKFDIYYYDEHFKSCVLASRITKYAIILLTSLVTGAWMAWNNYSVISLLCSIIIWLLQAFSAVSEHFPFEKRKLELREMSAELDRLYINMECDWRKIHALEMSNEEIRSAIQSYDLKQADICIHYLKDDALPEKERIIKHAHTQTNEYFKNFI